MIKLALTEMVKFISNVLIQNQFYFIKSELRIINFKQPHLQDFQSFLLHYFRTFSSVYSSFVKSILAYPMTEQVCFFLVPSISSSLHIPSLLNVFVESDEANANEIQSIWMLYSLILVFEQQQQGI